MAIDVISQKQYSPMLSNHLKNKTTDKNVKEQDTQQQIQQLARYSPLVAKTILAQSKQILAQNQSQVQKTVAVVDDIDENSQMTAGHIQTISASTQEQTASMQEIAASSRTLADIANDLKNATNKFSV